MIHLQLQNAVCEKCGTKGNWLIVESKQKYGCLFCAQKKSDIAGYLLTKQGDKKIEIRITKASGFAEFFTRCSEVKCVFTKFFIPDDECFNWKEISS